MAPEAGEIQDDASPFSNGCVRSPLSPGVGFKANIKGIITKPFQIQQTVRYGMLVPTCGIASGQRSCDEALTEDGNANMLQLKRYGAQESRTNSRGGPPNCRWFGKLSPWLAAPVGCDLVSLGSSLSSPKHALPNLLRHGYACISRNLKPFYIRSFSGDGSCIFVSLCEQIPKMSNPLQASLQCASWLRAASLPRIVRYPSVVFGHNHLPSGFVSEHDSLICKQHWLLTAQNR